MFSCQLKFNRNWGNTARKLCLILRRKHVRIGWFLLTWKWVNRSLHMHLFRCTVEIWSGLKSSLQICSILHFEKINTDIFPKTFYTTNPNFNKYFEIWGSLDGDYEEYHLLQCKISLVDVYWHFRAIFCLHIRYWRVSQSDRKWSASLAWLTIWPWILRQDTPSKRH
jgi:hypothetical protein